MDIQYYRMREEAELRSAEVAAGADARAAHIALARSYRDVIEAYERLETVRPSSTPSAIAV